ncbi:hypothetical protein ILUMI_20567 [Ignelater luminosus]|uniref:Serpin domain-containing protein n=1 Tax=Ignelater luminosus TaxID=2038154 RepID=A0A8K0CKN1_IGNLU|nr:hypothetical protein ILUMI_20567 [Ignelater luminosus]
MKTQLLEIFIKKYCKLLIVFFIVTSAVQCKVDTSDEKSLIRGCNKFGDDIYKEVAKHKGNVVFSPFALHSSMALLTMGASGNTLKELLFKLSLNNVHNFKKGYETLIKRIQNESFHVANNLYISKKLYFLEKYRNEARHFFKAKPVKLDFTKQARATAIINKWVAEQTNKSIDKIVDVDSFDSHTALILLNAIYFKGEWETKFDEAQTLENYVFHTSTGETFCSMMFMKPSQHNILFTDKYSILTLPFHKSNIKIAFIKVGPKNITISALEEIFSSKRFFQAISQLRPKNAIIKIPKFNISTNYELNKHLSSVGISNIFKSPSFSNLFRKNVLVSVDTVNQKSLLEINENGVKAAATTQIRMRVRAAPLIHKFYLDSPFLFFIYDSKDELIIFRGRIENPIESENK